MVHRGRSANDAIDKIYQAYGYKTSVTTIINNHKKIRRITLDSSSEGVFSHPAFPLIKITFFVIFI